MFSRLHAAAGALFPPKGEEKKSKVEAERHARQAYQHAHHASSALMVTYRPSELRAYALDFGGGLLRAFGDGPHFGGVAGKRDPERVRATISQIRAMIHEREACFRELGIDSMAEARERRVTSDLTPSRRQTCCS